MILTVALLVASAASGPERTDAGAPRFTVERGPGRARQLSGVVVDELGVALGDTHVALHGSAKTSFKGEVLTDSDGGFSFTGIPPKADSVELTFEREGSATLIAQFGEPSNVRSVRAILGAPQVLSGTLRGPQETRTTLILSHLDGRRVAGAHAEDGGFVFRALHAGSRSPTPAGTSWCSTAEVRAASPGTSVSAVTPSAPQRFYGASPPG